MKRAFTGKAIAAFALLLSVAGAAPASASDRLPRAFHGKWASDLANCGETGELTPMTIDASGILQYEGGWTIRRWSKRGNVWMGRGFQEDDQGRMAATVRLRLRADGTLNFISDARSPFPDEPGLLRCPTPSSPRR